MTWYEKLSHKLEGKAFKFSFWTTIAILVGGLVEIPPFFMAGYQAEIREEKLVTHYSALELAGRDVYQEEGCFYCHTQMIRPFRWETVRWNYQGAFGEAGYSKAGEYIYDHPFLWGSKRTGPDLSHESKAKSASWQKEHLINPQEQSPGSIMPAYPHLFDEDNLVDADALKSRMGALRTIGVPYTDAEISGAEAAVKGKTKGDALVAYLMKLGRDYAQ